MRPGPSPACLTALAVAATIAACGGGSSGPSTSDGGPPPAQQQVFYVDAKSGRDGNDGLTASTAFATLNHAAAAVKPGWTVLVMSGTYTSDGGANPLTINAQGRSDAWITFAAAPGQHPVIQIPRAQGATAGIYLPGAAYVIVDGFEVIGQNQSITAQEAASNDGSQSVLNQNCIYIDGMGFADFHPPVPHDIVIRNNTVHDCSAGGIEVNVADAVRIEHNRVYDTSWWTVFGTSGIVLWHMTDVPGSTTTNGYKNFVVGNLVYGNQNNLPWKDISPPGIYDGNGIIVDDARHSQNSGGIYDVRGVPYTGRTYIANNIVHDNGGRGIHIYSSDHVDVANNTAYNNLLSSSEHIAWGELDAFRCSDVNVLNNIGVNLNGKEVNVADSGSRYDYNLWDAANVPFKGDHDVVGKANLTDPANGNFAPLAGSPALRSGTSTTAPADDFFGNPRPAGAVDRGAVQVSK
ncbi:MAG TPA: right-handed parallel beta-helix repeat-containing protein [Myxococcales bacterium]|nr:right-handed parallel beta-helix repeat-containing protein [Myxococcales bacterium]